MAANRRGTQVKAPPSLKLVEGRGNGRDSGGREVRPTPAFRREAPDLPDLLYGEARAEWDRIVPELERLDLLKLTDRAALVAYCLTWQRFCSAQAMLEERGLTAETSQGVGVAPWVRILESASKELRAWGHEFGLTPSAENNLAAAGGDDGSESNPFGHTG